LPKLKHRIMARRMERYPWILYYRIAYFVRNTAMVELCLHVQQAKNTGRDHELIDVPIPQNRLREISCIKKVSPERSQ
jgi:hypothetical protein